MAHRTPSANPFPCRNCGYDLRGGSREVCPECGEKIALSSGSKTSPSEDANSNIIQALEGVQKGVGWSLILWFGCIAAPWIGGLAWVALALVSAWRTLALWKLRQTTFVNEFGPNAVLGQWWNLMRAELAVAIVGGLMTAVASLNDVPLPVQLLLSLTHIAWVGLVGYNNLAALTLATLARQRFGEGAVEAHMKFAPLAAIIAPLLWVPFFLLTMLNRFVTVPEWIGATITIILAVGCIAGIASVVMTRTALQDAGEALLDYERKQKAARKRSSTRRSNPAQSTDENVREHRRPIDDDPIPLADDPNEPPR